MNNKETILNTPKNLSDFAGQFVVFFSEDENPQVLFNSFMAEEIKQKEGREPIVFRVQENTKSNVSQVLAMRF